MQTFDMKTQNNFATLQHRENVTWSNQHNALHAKFEGKRDNYNIALHFNVMNYNIALHWIALIVLNLTVFSDCIGLNCIFILSEHKFAGWP